MAQRKGKILDILKYKIEDVAVYRIPPPRKEDGFKHNISFWKVDTEPIWRGNLELHELETVEDDDSDDDYDDYDAGETQKEAQGIEKAGSAVNPFDKAKIDEEINELKKSFMLMMYLKDSNNEIFAKVPMFASFDLNEKGIVRTDSAKLYAIFAEVEDDCEIEISSTKQGSNDTITSNANKRPHVKRVALGLKFPSSYEAGNFSTELQSYERELNFRIKLLRQNEAADVNDSDSDTGMGLSTEKTYNQLTQELHDVHINRIDSESDGSDDDFGEFTEISQ